MKYHTIKSERWNLRANGAYATYPIYTHDGLQVGNLECYAEAVDRNLKIANAEGKLIPPFYPIEPRDSGMDDSDGSVQEIKSAIAKAEGK